MNYIKHLSIKFARANRLTHTKITLRKLLYTARKCGYIVKSYSKSYTTMVLLNVYKRAQKSSSVSIIDTDGNVYIFIDDTMPKEKQLFALAHEIGHILLKHNPNDCKKRRQEREANLFAHYLLDADYDIKRLKSTISYLLLIIFLFLAIIFYLLYAQSIPQKQTTGSSSRIYYTAPAITNNSSPNKNNYVSQHTIEEPTTSSYIEITGDTECYFTEYGKVYHLYDDCHYIKNSNIIYCDTIENNPNDRLCSYCEKRLYKK